MWCQVLYSFTFFAIVLSEMTAPGIDRTIDDGVKSMGYNVVYGDEDMTVINEVVSDFEKMPMKARIVDGQISPLPAEDVKCLMSVDRYCSKEMGQMKSVIIRALKDDCKDCNDDQKEKAGKIVASMMAHDPVAWKQFLTRSALQTRTPKEEPMKDESNTLQFKPIGEPEEILKSRSRHTKPGFNVKVKRSAAEVKPTATGFKVKRPADQIETKPSANNFKVKRFDQVKQRVSIRLPKL